MFANPSMEHTPDWMVWQRENLVGVFDERATQLDAGVNWTIGDRQDFRVRLQALGLDAPLKQAYRTAVDGTPIPSNEPVDDFSLSQLGFQIRYRYELAPPSDLYVVYGRGGGVFNEFSEETNTLLRDAFEMRDAEQFLVKVSYRFEK